MSLYAPSGVIWGQSMRAQLEKNKVLARELRLAALDVAPYVLSLGPDDQRRR
jgi:hypothetical protein